VEAVKENNKTLSDKEEIKTLQDNMEISNTNLQNKLRIKMKTDKELHGLSPRAKYTDRATAACRRSDCQLFLQIEVATWSS
jgi:hypothetical protein